MPAGRRNASLAPKKRWRLLKRLVGNFIAVIGDVGSRKLVREVIASFRQHAEFPSEGGAVPQAAPGAGWSDHWSFWQAGYPAVMITDTAPFRYPYYHKAEDTPDKLDFDRMARVVAAVEAIVGEFAGAKPARGLKK